VSLYVMSTTQDVSPMCYLLNKWYQSQWFKVKYLLVDFTK